MNTREALDLKRGPNCAPCQPRRGRATESEDAQSLSRTMTHLSRARLCEYLAGLARLDHSCKGALLLRHTRTMRYLAPPIIIANEDPTKALLWDARLHTASAFDCLKHLDEPKGAYLSSPWLLDGAWYRVAGLAGPNSRADPRALPAPSLSSNYAEQQRAWQQAGWQANHP